MSRFKSYHPKKLLFLGFLTLVISACADDKPLNTFEPRGPRAQTIYDLMTPWVWVIMFLIGFGVIFGTIALAVKGRVSADDDLDDLPEQVHGNPTLEWGWTIAPFILLVGLSIPMVGTIWELEEENEPSELDVMVIGQQWWWEYRYDIDGDGFFQDANGDGVVDEQDEELPLEISLDRDDVATATELVIPAGEQVDLLITSRDVIHSFWIPRLNGKRDAVPGRLHTWSLEADEPGKFVGWCTEFCGLSHARMRMSTIALEPEDFDSWLENQSTLASVPEDESALAGREIFAQNCASCHIINEESSGRPDITPIEYADDFVAPLDSLAAPNLTHFASRSSFAGGIYGVYLGEEIGDPNDDALDVDNYLALAQLSSEEGSGFRVNEPELARWISDASSRKDMAPESLQGMPSFSQLTDENLDDVIAYLSSLD